MILQYGNLTILSVEELNGGMFPKVQSYDGIKIYGEDKWRVHRSHFSIFGINIEVPDIYPILKYPEARVKAKTGNERYISHQNDIILNVLSKINVIRLGQITTADCHSAQNSPLDSQ